jgi:predicted ArsR family transcriptional regulator
VRRPNYYLRESRILALLARPHTGIAIGTKLHMCRHTVSSYMRNLRTEGKAHISGWVSVPCTDPKRGSRPQPLFKAGRGKDAVYKPQTDYERGRLYQVRRKADEDRHDRYLAKARIYQRKGVKPQPELAAFFGVGI